MVNQELKILSDELRKIFSKVYEKIRDKNISDRSLDSEVLAILESVKLIHKDKDLEISFSEPNDEIYKTDRAPYDLLCYRKISGNRFSIFINNKFGNLFGNSKNDIKTYNNLIRLYLGVSKQRLTSKISIDLKVIRRRVANEEIVSYGVFIVDNKKRGFNFFLLEEVQDDLYINPRNTMFQIRYNPSLRDPIDYYSFCMTLIDVAILSLERNIKLAKSEIIVLSEIKRILVEVGSYGR